MEKRSVSEKEKVFQPRLDPDEGGMIIFFMTAGATVSAKAGGLGAGEDVPAEAEAIGAVSIRLVTDFSSSPGLTISRLSLLLSNTVESAAYVLCRAGDKTLLFFGASLLFFTKVAAMFFATIVPFIYLLRLFWQ